MWVLVASYYGEGSPEVLRVYRDKARAEADKAMIDRTYPSMQIEVKEVEEDQPEKE